MGELSIILSDLRSILHELNTVFEKHMWEGVGLVLLTIYGPLYLRYIFRWVCQGKKRRRLDDSKAWSLDA
jgi:hypothetical protein